MYWGIDNVQLYINIADVETRISISIEVLCYMPGPNQYTIEMRLSVQFNQAILLELELRGCE